MNSTDAAIIIAACSILALQPALAQGMYEYAAGAGLGGGLGAGVAASNSTLTKAANSLLTGAQARAALLTISRLSAQAKQKEAAGDTKGSAQLYEQIARLRERIAGLSGEAADSYNKAAQLRIASGEFPHAELLYKAALAACSRANGPGSDHSIASLTGLAEALEGQKRYGEAMTNYKQSLALEERHSGADSAQAEGIREKLTHLCLASGKYGDAETLLSQSISYAEKQPQRDETSYKKLLSSYENVLRDDFKTAEADKVKAKLDALSGISTPPPGAETTQP